MASLFLGELYRMTCIGGVLLLIRGFVVALTTNVGRTFYLSLSAAKSGLPVTTSRHDSAGFTTLAICFGNSLGYWPVSVAKRFRLERRRAVCPPAIVSLRFAGGLALWLLATLGATEAWYYDDGKPPQSEWAVTLPPNSERVEVDAACSLNFSATGSRLQRGGRPTVASGCSTSSSGIPGRCEREFLREFIGRKSAYRQLV
jgi:hypothetical protein